MASNPVFNRLDKQMNQGGYAGFGRGSGRGATGPGVQDTMSASQLEDLYNRGTAGPVQTGRVTLDDVVMKTMGLFVVLLAGRRRRRGCSATRRRRWACRWSSAGCC